MKSNVSLIIMMCLFGAVQIQAQDIAQHKRDYPFINWDAHNLEFYGDSTKFNVFFEKLEQLIFEGYGQVHVLHMGGSHVQAGTMSRQMRENLHEFAPGLKGERGFMFPYHLAKTNNPYDYRTHYTGEWEGLRAPLSRHEATWGIAAVAAETRDSGATVTLYANAKDGSMYTFNRVRIFYEITPDSYVPTLKGNYNVASRKVNNQAQYVEYFFNQQYDTLHFYLEKTDSIQTRFLIQGIQYLTGEPGITYHSIGANGASVPSYLRCELLPEQLKSMPPDLVIFGIGINDANTSQANFDPQAYQAQYRALMEYIKKANPEVNFLFITNNDSYYNRKYPNPNALKVREVMRDLATEYNGAVWDLFEVMGGLNSCVTWEKAGLAKSDRIHFTPDGYRLQGDLMFDGLRTAFGNYLNNKYATKLEP